MVAVGYVRANSVSSVDVCVCGEGRGCHCNTYYFRTDGPQTDVHKQLSSRCYLRRVMSPTEDL